jgi:SAM-dependent methyltransferase
LVIKRRNIREYFNDVYGETQRYWWQGPERYETDPDAYPTSLLTQNTLRLLRGRAPGDALDIGSGEGADAIRLAKLGYEVDVVEVSDVGAEKIQVFAAEAEVGERLRIFRCDVLDFQPDRKYDVVICNGVLHYVKDKHSAIELMQKATRPGGLNVISLWSDYTPVPRYHDDLVPVYADAEDGVVASSYKKWPKESLYFERDKAEAAHADLPPHRHSHIKLIARKPLA